MTAFNSQNIELSGAYGEYWLHYFDGQKREFIGRFKYARPKMSAVSFANFLKRNFTVEEFFKLRGDGMSPGPILETKGYVCPNVKAARAARARMEKEAAFWANLKIVGV